MAIINIKTDIRSHEIHIEEATISKWFCIVGEIKTQMSYQMKKPYKIYEDKKGRFIKLGFDGIKYKHYMDQ